MISQEGPVSGDRKDVTMEERQNRQRARQRQIEEQGGSKIQRHEGNRHSVEKRWEADKADHVCGPLQYPARSSEVKLLT